jgi:fructose-1,6-bisphosphatase/inositol monophosphatase family enzyme
VADDVGEGTLDDVADVIRAVAATAVMPRFGALLASDVTGKGVDDIVTVADIEAEEMLTERLGRIRPGLPVLGEEACSTDPGLRHRVQDEGTYWVVDPLDGTREFVAGRSGFGLMAALVVDGETAAAWIHLPATGRLYDGARGLPVRRDGHPMPAPAPGRHQGSAPVRGFALTRLAPPDVRAPLEARQRELPDRFEPGPPAAAVAYTSMLEGRLGFGFYWRTEPWDHAPGALLVQLAGGRSARLDGRPYLPADDSSGLLVTTDGDQWRVVHDDLMLPGGSSPPTARDC